MSRRPKNGHTLGEHGIFGDEEAARLRSDLDELRAQLTEMSERVHSQFTTIAAHAEIARQQSEQARAEARHDLDRTRDTLIGLIEQVRGDAHGHAAGSTPGTAAATGHDRLDGIEQRLTRVAELVDTSFRRQGELADTMAALIDTVFAEQRTQPVAGLALD